MGTGTKRQRAAKGSTQHIPTSSKVKWSGKFPADPRGRPFPPTETFLVGLEARKRVPVSLTAHAHRSDFGAQSRTIQQSKPTLPRTFFPSREPQAIVGNRSIKALCFLEVQEIAEERDRPLEFNSKWAKPNPLYRRSWRSPERSPRGGRFGNSAFGYKARSQEHRVHPFEVVTLHSLHHKFSRFQSYSRQCSTSGVHKRQDGCKFHRSLQKPGTRVVTKQQGYNARTFARCHPAAKRRRLPNTLP